MRTFRDLDALADHFEAVALAVPDAAAALLDATGRAVVRRTRAHIGYYQPQIGPVPAWEPLAPRTLQDKRRLGYTGHRSADDPLLRTGALMRSYSYGLALMAPGNVLRGWSVRVGSPLVIALWMEIGTEKMPPRPVLSGATAEEARAFGVAAGKTFFALWTA